MPPVIYYIRHGVTEWNADHRLQGQADNLLNEEGCAQATRCGEILRGLLARDGRTAANLDFVSSPLVRARSSMELIRASLGLDPAGFHIDERLIEMSFGQWDGWTFSDLKARAADLLAVREQDPWNFAPPGGESYAQLLPRVRDWHATLTRDTVVSGHLCAGRALLAHLGIVSPAAAPRSSIEHGAVYVFDGNGMTRHTEPAGI